MKKVAIISTGKQPVPPVKGGAVETGIQQIIDENEKNGKVQLTVFSIYNQSAKEQSERYTKTSFIYIQLNCIHSAFNFFIKCVNKIFKMFKINYKINGNLPYTSKLKRKINEGKFDVILIKNAPDYVLPLAKQFNSQIILQIHNDYLNRETYNANQILKKCKKIIVVSNYIKNRVLTIDGCESSKVIVNKNCTDIGIFNNQLYKNMTSELKKKYQVNESEVTILFSGRLIKEKGIKELFLAVSLLPKELKWKLLVIGGKWYSNEKSSTFIEEIKKLSSAFSERIIFTGYVPYDELGKLYSITDIAVVPSMWEEPAGRVVIEAEAAGVPVITSNAGGISDYISENTSIVVERNKDFVKNLSQAIFALINNKALRENMAKSAFEYGQKFTPSRYYEEFIELIN